MKLFDKTVFTYSVVCSDDIIIFAMMNTETLGVRYYEISKYTKEDELKNIISSLCCNGVYWCTYNGRFHDETILNYCTINYKQLQSTPRNELAWVINNFCDRIHSQPIADWINYKHAYKFASFDLSPIFYNRGYVEFEDAKLSLNFNDVAVRIPDKSLCATSKRQQMRYIAYKNISEYTSILKAKTKDVLFREYVTKTIGVNVMNNNITTIGSKLLNAFYENLTGKSIGEINNHYTGIPLAEIIPVDYQLGHNDFLESLRKIVITPDYNLNLPLFDYNSTLTFGGIKSSCQRGITRNNGCHIYHIDIKSAWPTALVNFKLAPNGVGVDGFVGAVKHIIHLKETTHYRDEFKRALNSVIGNLMTEDSKLHDYKSFISIKILSALETISLIESLDFIDIIQINNDGIVFTSNEDYESIKGTISDWEVKHNAKTTLIEYDLFCQYSLNDWFAHYDNTTVCKGIFLAGSTKYPLASTSAVILSIIDDMNPTNAMLRVEKHLFILGEKAGENEEFFIEKNDRMVCIGKRVRYYYVKDGISLYKKNINGGNVKKIKEHIALIGCTMDDLYYPWYTKKAFDLYNELKVTQLSLFNDEI